jgi:hypothetical protein
MENTTGQLSARLKEIQQAEIARHLGSESAGMAVQVAEQFMKRVSAWLSCQLQASDLPEQHRQALAFIFELDECPNRRSGSND